MKRAGVGVTLKHKTAAKRKRSRQRGLQAGDADHWSCLNRLRTHLVGKGTELQRARGLRHARGVQAQESRGGADRGKVAAANHHRARCLQQIARCIGQQDQAKGPLLQTQLQSAGLKQRCHVPTSGQKTGVRHCGTHRAAQGEFARQRQRDQARYSGALATGLRSERHGGGTHADRDRCRRQIQQGVVRHATHATNAQAEIDAEIGGGQRSAGQAAQRHTTRRTLGPDPGQVTGRVIGQQQSHVHARQRQARFGRIGRVHAEVARPVGQPNLPDIHRLTAERDAGAALQRKIARQRQALAQRQRAAEPETGVLRKIVRIERHAQRVGPRRTVQGVGTQHGEQLRRGGVHPVRHQRQGVGRLLQRVVKPVAHIHQAARTAKPAGDALKGEEGEYIAVLRNEAIPQAHLQLAVQRHATARNNDLIVKATPGPGCIAAELNLQHRV